MTKHCAECGRFFRCEGRGLYCDQCRSGRESRLAAASARRRNRLHPEVSRAGSLVAHAIATGRLQRPDQCSECDAVTERNHPINGHHDDYTKPLEVRWLCPQCHTGLHAQQRREAAA